MRLISIALLLAGPAIAGPAPDRLSFLLGSHHANPAEDFEEVNPEMFLTWDGDLLDGRVDLNVGAFRNSYGREADAVVTFGVTVEVGR